MYLEVRYGCPTGAPPFFVKRYCFSVVAITKNADRFLSLLTHSADEISAERLIKRLVTSSPKSVSLETLSHLLAPQTPNRLSHHALPLYLKMTEMAWFEWNPTLAAELAALLHKQCRSLESEKLVSDSISKLKHSKSDRGLSMFLCELLTSHAKHGSSDGFNETYERLFHLVRGSTSAYVKRQSYKAMLQGLCEMKRPSDAEALLSEESWKMRASVFELRCILQGYGRIGMLSDMERIFYKLEEMMNDKSYDTVSFNMMLSCYGSHNAIGKMVVCLRKMKELSVPLSLRTCNTVFNSCPSLIHLVGVNGSKSPISMKELEMELPDDERALAGELSSHALKIEGIMMWDKVRWKLDMHGMHLTTAYVVILEWVNTMKRRVVSGSACPVEVTVVSGLGNHSSVRGESPVRCLVKSMIVRIGVPMKADRKNKGCFVAKGKVMVEWLKNYKIG